jgi:Family of unknown function (DUF6159)
MPDVYSLNTEQSTSEGRIARSWRLTKVAWTVVRGDRALLALAIISGVTGAAGIALILGLGGVFDAERNVSGQVALFALILSYPLMFVSVFLNTAIAAAAAAALEGEHLTVGEALAVPVRRIGQVAMWSLIAAVVGFVLEQLVSRLPLGGSIVARLVGVGWSVASLFAIPILALEDCSAPECLRRSAHVIKKRWGEGLGGIFMITGWAVLVMLPLVAIVIVAAVASASTPAIEFAVIGLGIAVAVAVVAVQLVVRQTFAVALYRYATTGENQGAFASGDLESPFRRRRGGLV